MPVNTPENAQKTAMSLGMAQSSFRLLPHGNFVFIFSSRWLLFLLYFNLFV